MSPTGVETPAAQDHAELHRAGVTSAVDDHAELHRAGVTSAVDDPLLVSFAGVAGNVLEWFDFACFGYFSDIIALKFFPPDQAGNAALVQSFAVFGVAFLARPLGGALIGQLGDRVGRKMALETSLLVMALPTFAMGCLPTYSMISWGATILLAICRLFQGLSVGGQVMTSVVFTMERKDRSRWGVWGGAVTAAQSTGVTLGSLFSYVLREALADEQLKAWGWRIPFWVGVLGALPGLYLKKYGTEQPIPQIDGGTAGANEGEPNPPQTQKSAVAKSFEKSNLCALLSTVLVVALPAAGYYIIFIWLAIFMESIVDPPVPQAFAINTAVNVLGVVLTILAGWIADRRGHYVRLMVGSGLGLAVASPLLLAVVGDGDPIVAFACQMTLAFLLVLWIGAMLPWMVASSPPARRLTSVSIGYNIAVCIFGGSAPSLATLLVDRYGVHAPGWYMASLAVLSTLGLIIAPKEHEANGGCHGDDVGHVETENMNAASVNNGVIT